MRRRLPLLLAGLMAATMAFASRLPGTRAEEPLVVSPEVIAEFADYMARRKPLYFAVSSDGLFSWYMYCLDYNCQPAQTNRRMTIDRCEQRSGVDCVIFASGEEIQVDYRVGDPATMAPANTKPCEIEAFAAGSTAVAAVAALRAGECSDLRRFGYYDDFKAFATTDPRKFRNAWGWSYRYGSPEDAMKAALEQCAKLQKELSVADPCAVFAIGDIVIDGMAEADRRAAAETYKKNRDATNADLSSAN